MRPQDPSKTREESKTVRRKYDGIGLFSSKAVGEIVMTNGKMTASMNIDIMSKNLKKYIRNLNMGRLYIFQRDNDPKNTSKIGQDYFSKNKIKVLD
ncbi:hypothetical protein AVEN_247972-1 [Araneus ventricosus]|uniref:Transposase n=1 Tax=Araneus ventricosus TaxID=182803 RepID=A0A4Y2CJJ0_ARAVE|nr:hypothetical protein AVEN_247972-1 [Araneus ventricosus]